MLRFFLLLLSCVFLAALCLGTILVTRGYHLDQLSLANISAQDISLTWNNGLQLEVGTAEIDAQEGAESTRLSGEAVRRGLHTVRFLSRFVASCTVKSLRYSTYQLQLLRENQESGGAYLFTLKGKDVSLTATLTAELDKYRIEVQEFSSQKYRSTATGSFLFDPETVQSDGELRANLADVLPVQLKVSSDINGITFQGRDDGEITAIKPFVELFGLSPEIEPWITEYLNGSRYHLQEVHGTVPWRDPAAILETLSAKVRVDDCAYIFAQGLAPIKTAYTDVMFAGGVLHIDPHGSSFYGQDGGESRLDIDFNDAEHILLTAFIKTRAQLNADIIRLLEYYNIQLPLRQTTGKTATDLTIAITLNSGDVDISGEFIPEKGEFSYKGQQYQVGGGRIGLEQTDISIDALQLGFTEKTRYSARVDGNMNFTEARTDLAIALEHFTLPLQKKTLVLHTSTGPLRLGYHLRAGRATLAIPSSSWTLGNEQLQLDALTMPFDFHQFAGRLPSTRLVIPRVTDLLFEGSFNGKKEQLDIQVTLRRLQARTIALADAPLVLDVQYDGTFHFSTAAESLWKFSNKEITLSPCTVHYSEEQIRIEKTHIQAGLFDTSVHGDYNLQADKGELLLNELVVAAKDREPLFQVPSSMRLNMEKTSQGTRIDIDELGLSLYSQGPDSWGIKIRDFGVLNEHSRLLRRLKVKDGSLHLITAGPTTPLRFSGALTSSYAFLVQGDQPQSVYDFSGIYTDAGLELVINEDMRIHWDKDITITTRTQGFNIPALTAFWKDRTQQQALDVQEKDFPEITMKAEESFLFFRPGNRILADTMNLQVKGAQRDLTITQGQGKIKVEIQGEEFSLEGQNLGDTFLNALMRDAEFEGGQLAAYAEGTFDTCNVLMRLDKVLLKNYTMLNNMLAVINTLPALITFSLPNYDRDGWPVDSVVLGFDYHQGVATVKTMELNSEELDMRGVGTVDVFSQQLDLKINLITQAGQNVSSIPLVGYILAGEEQRPTLTWHVTGDLMDPEVDNTAFEEIGTMPFKMIFRTLKTPFHWADKLSDQDTDRSETGDTPEADSLESSTILPSEK